MISSLEFEKEFFAYVKYLGGALEFSIRRVARHFAYPESLAREMLLEWAGRRLITLTSYDPISGECRSWLQYQHPDKVYSNSGVVTVSLRAHGEDLSRLFNRASMGFI